MGGSISHIWRIWIILLPVQIRVFGANKMVASSIALSGLSFLCGDLQVFCDCDDVSACCVC